MEFRQIEAFREVIRHGSATLAARALGITQPAVSRLVRDLERATGLLLFERGRRHGLRPTADGLLLFEEVERSYAGLARLREAARDIRERRTGRLRVIAMPAYAEGSVARLLGGFLRAHPGITAELEVGGKLEAVRQVAAGQADLGVATAPLDEATGPATMVRTETLDARVVVCVAPYDHPLASAAGVEPSDIAGQAFVALSRTNPLRAQIDAALAAYGAPPPIPVAEARTQRAVYQLVAAGAGIGLIDVEVAREAALPDVAVLPFRPAIAWDLLAVRPVRREPSEACAALLDWLRAGYRRS
jgi:DNA-binding transcriptional LysR family regulator